MGEIGRMGDFALRVFPLPVYLPHLLMHGPACSRSSPLFRALTSVLALDLLVPSGVANNDG